MVFIDKKSGRVSLTVEPLTKKGNIAKRGGEKSVHLQSDPNINRPVIENEGKMIDTKQAKQIGKKYKGQIKDAKSNKKKVLEELPKVRPDRDVMDDFELNEELRTATQRLREGMQNAHNQRRNATFDELRGIGRTAMSRIQQEDSGVEEHKSPESHEMLRQRQEGRRATAFEELRGIGKKAVKKMANAENYAANRDRIRQHRNERVQCACGDTVMRTNMARHLKTKRHLDRMG
jgi:hypothetical protein